jgi:hypothetical protein
MKTIELRAEKYSPVLFGFQYELCEDMVIKNMIDLTICCTEKWKVRLMYLAEFPHTDMVRLIVHHVYSNNKKYKP